jgi:transposase
VAFTAKLALGSSEDGKTMAEVAHQQDVHANHVAEWRQQRIEHATSSLGGMLAPEAPPVDLKVLHATSGQPTPESEERD